MKDKHSKYRGLRLLALLVFLLYLILMFCVKMAEGQNCGYVHPPKTENAKKVLALFKETLNHQWVVEVQVSYAKRKMWKHTFPERFDEVIEAVKFYEKWRLHVFSVIHATNEERKKPHLPSVRQNRAILA